MALPGNLSGKRTHGVLSGFPKTMKLKLKGEVMLVWEVSRMVLGALMNR